MRIRSIVIAALLVAGCKKEKAATPPAPSPKGPINTAEQDALWKLAPDGTRAGIVLSSQGVASMESGWLAVRKLITTAPELAPVAAQMEQELTKVFGSSNVKLADVGMAPGKGAALFGLDDGAELVIIPVVDRDKFLAVTKGTKGTDSDTIDKHTCKNVQSFYACAKPAELLERVGKAPMGDTLKLAGARGDIELAVSIPDPGAGRPPVTVAAVGQIERGGIVVRGAVKGVPDMIASKLKASGKQTIDANKAAGFAVMNVAPLLAGAPVPPEPIAPGVTLADLASNIDGAVTITIPPGSTVFDVHVPMKDTAPAQKVVEGCDQIPPLQMLGAKVQNGVCHVSVPQMMMELDAWVEGKELRIGKKGAPAPASVAPTGIASELTQGEWAFAMFGRGTLLGEGQFPSMPMGALPAEAKMGLRMMMFINEIGFGVRADGDTVRFLASARTAWSNPDDVVAKIVAIAPEDIANGKASAAAKQIANASPSSPFAGDFKAGLGGVMIPAATIGILAAVAIPAFIDYQRKAKAYRDHVPTDMPDGINDLQGAPAGAN